MKYLTAITILIVMILGSGCATQPGKIQASYTSPMQYNNYDCDQVAMELDMVSRRSQNLHTSLKKEADADAAQMAIGLVLFWPTLFLLEGGDSPEAAEYARLKGDLQALEKVAILKKCDIIIPEIMIAPATAEAPDTSDY